MARAARSTSIDPNQIQIVHVWNRCVRRAFLCGQDPLSGRDFEHRRQWARERLEHLASIFAIDCLTFSIMQNHTHQVLRSRPDVVATWDDQQVAKRWLKISLKKDKFGNPIQPTKASINRIVNNPELLAKIRVRLSDVSWWMRYFSHHIAVRSNQEDAVQGHFWESRFGSELIENQASVLACMIYVDLNPVRARMAETPEESDYTGVKERIDDLRIAMANGELDHPTLSLTSSDHSIHDWERLGSQHSGWLSPVEIREVTDPIGPDPELSERRASRKGAAAISLTRYLELLDWIGRQVRGDKRGAIPGGLAPILSRLGLTVRSLFAQLRRFGSPKYPMIVDTPILAAAQIPV